MKKFLCAMGIFVLVLQSCFVSATVQPTALTLQQAVDLAIQNNPQLKKIAFAQQGASAQLQLSKASTYPSLSLSLSANPPIGGTYPISGGATSTYNSTTTNTSLNASYTLYSGGSITNGIKAAETNLSAAECSVEKTKQSLKYDATKAYYDVINAKNQLHVQETAFNNANDHLQIVTAQYEEGSVPKGDVLRTQVTVSTAKQSLIVAKNNYSKALLNLKNVMNIPAKTNIELSESFTVHTRNVDSEKIINYAIDNNPDIQLAKFTIQIDEYNYRIQQASYYPTISLTASGYHGFNSASGATTDYTNQLGFSVGASLSFNIFNGFQTKNQVAIAKLQIDEDNQTLEQLKLDTTLTVSSALDDTAAAYEVINTARASLDSAQEDLEIKQVRYAAGMGTNIDVLDAQQALTADNTNYWQAVYSYNLAIAYLEKVAGLSVK